MEHNETSGENLAKLSVAELEALEAEMDSQDTTTGEDTIDWKAKAEEAERKAATLQRILNKKQKNLQTIKQEGTPANSDVAELKYYHKIETLAEEAGITKAQAKKLLEVNPNATVETLKDPFFAEGLKALVRRDNIDSAMPARSSLGSVNGKSFSQMSREERVANFSKITGAN